jgi:prolyl-tRNA editing enzyme YbaK/EbsC (Cys-tRNA(Pro) deacylase)
VQDHLILVIASGDQRVDDRKLATLFGVTRKAVTFATPDQGVEYFSEAPGSVPPVGHRQKPHAVYLDDILKRYTHIYPAGGANNAIFGVTFAQLAYVNSGIFVNVKLDP